MKNLFLLVLLLLSTTSTANSLHFSKLIHHPKNSFKSIRDLEIIKQEFDYSCGSASLATIINFFYKIDVTEQDILNKLTSKTGNKKSSFKNLSEVAKSYNFNSIGISITFEQLKMLQIPAIVYLHIDNNEHFSVIRGINNEFILLGDPSWGNFTMHRNDFLQFWEKNGLGKVLIITPIDSNLTINKEFFKDPNIQSDLIRSLLNFR